MTYPEKIDLILTYKNDPNDTEIFIEGLVAAKINPY
ncbi:MAG: hypothetical protein JWQ27_62 [Ferruginibacter sp.]|nr:hypothetical protein [Ferruginibacter sp.]